MRERRRSATELGNELKRFAKEEAERDHARLLHELRVYQEELTTQNEELIRAQTALEETRDRFVELYDFAPNGYMTLDEHGVVRQINLTGVAMFGKERRAVEGLPLMGFVKTSDRPHVLDFIRRCRSDRSQAGCSADVTIRGGDQPRFVQLLCRPRTRSASTTRGEFFTAMIDMTDQKRLEHEREHAAQQRVALASRLISIQEEERQRIARDLHDNIGQQLTGLRLKLDGIGLMPGLGENVRQQIMSALTAADELDRALDFIASELRPTALNLGLVTALDQFIREWSATFNVSAELHTGDLGELRLTTHVETHVYRIAQEALNNVYKHAQARHVNVVLECRRGDLLLVVEDNGRGFVPGDVQRRRSRGMGLMSMHERAAIIGSTLEIESGPGRGTAVFLRVPVDAPATGGRVAGGG